ncbi:hypothetical protein PSU51_21535, partial [Yersinia pestis]|nr:hypothetical protein [Yersinia pestis]
LTVVTSLLSKAEAVYVHQALVCLKSNEREGTRGEPLRCSTPAHRCLLYWSAGGGILGLLPGLGDTSEGQEHYMGQE